jgi:inward rectifier potassium channel
MKKIFSNKKEIEEIQDTGLSSKYNSRTERLIGRDGNFTITKKGIPFFDSFNPYHWLIRISTLKFFMIVLITFVIANLFFATLYYINGVENLGIIEQQTNPEKFFTAFFFSAQTITTVGYGKINPSNFSADIIASIESLIGLLSFAVTAGLLYGRFSRPVANIVFSKNAVIAPFEGKTALQFRTANIHKSELSDAVVQVVFSPLEMSDGTEKRKFYNLKLEYHKINFFSSVWTVNHPIDDESPLAGLTQQDLQDSEAELLVLLKAFDETFAQTVNTRYSYRFDEIIWGARFTKIYDLDENGKLIVRLDNISDYENVNLELPEK